MMPFQWTDSDYVCVRCCKRMVVEHGQHEDSGQLVETHHCLNCGRTYDSQPERRSPDLTEAPARSLLITLEQMVELRTRGLDRPEFLRHQPGLREIVEEWADA